MSNYDPMENALPEDAALEAADAEQLADMLDQQLALNKNVISTNQFLRFALNVSNQNLAIIKEQLLAIQNLAHTLENVSPPPDVEPEP